MRTRRADPLVAFARGMSFDADRLVFLQPAMAQPKGVYGYPIESVAVVDMDDLAIRVVSDDQRLPGMEERSGGSFDAGPQGSDL